MQNSLLDLFSFLLNEIIHAVYVHIRLLAFFVAHIITFQIITEQTSVLRLIVVFANSIKICMLVLWLYSLRNFLSQLTVL